MDPPGSGAHRYYQVSDQSINGFHTLFFDVFKRENCTIKSKRKYLQAHPSGEGGGGEYMIKMHNIHPYYEYKGYQSRSRIRGTNSWQNTVSLCSLIFNGPVNGTYI